MLEYGEKNRKVDLILIEVWKKRILIVWWFKLWIILIMWKKLQKKIMK